MNLQISLLLICLHVFSYSFGQNPLIKEETKIETTFNYIYFKDGKTYLSKKGKANSDTTITDFNQDQTLKYPITESNPLIIRITSLDSIVEITETVNFKHQIEYWSDSSAVNIYTHSFDDSIIRVKVSNFDTIEIKNSYLKRGKLISSWTKDLSLHYNKFEQQILYDVNNKNRESATIITLHVPNGRPDTIKINNKKNVQKILNYNPYKKEWFSVKKTKTHFRKKVIRETFYHDYHEMYFTTRTTLKYNRFGLLKSQVVYDT